MIALHNVTDVRNNRFYSVAICSERMKKYFVPA